MNRLLSILIRSRAVPVLAAVSPLLAAESVQAEVYRCADAAGKVTYQAQPCPDSNVSKPVNIGAAAPQGAPRPAPSVQRQAGSPAWRIVAEDGPLSAPTRAAPPAAFATPAGQPRVLEPAPVPQGAAQWGRDADVLVVSGYQFSGSTTQVHVNHTDKPVLLVLTSYQQTQWKVLPAPGTRIKAIVVASHEARSTVLAPPQVPVAYDELPYAVETGSANFRELIGKLNGRYGVEKVTAFRGGYSLPALVPVTGPYVPDPNLSLEGLRPEVPRVRMSFDLLSIDGRRLPWTNSGPKDGKRYTGIVRGGGLGARHGGGPAVSSENGGEAYALEGNGSTLVWLPQGFGGASQKVEVPKSLPELSWGSGMAWDTRKGVLAIVSFGGEGYFYRYDTRKREWLGARSLQNRDLRGLALDASTGSYVAISDAAELVLFNERGEMDEVLPLAKLLPDLNTTFDRGNARPQGLTVAANGGVVAIINVRNASVTHIWTYELGSRKAQLTYKTVD